MIRSEHVDKKATRYITENCLRVTPVQTKLHEQSVSQGDNVAKRLGSADVTQLLQLLVKTTNAKRVLELGTLTGWTTVALAMALPTDGHVITVDNTHEHLNPVKSIWKEAGVDQKIHLKLGNVSDVLDKMLTDQELVGKIDLILIDADHKNVWHHLEKCLKLVRPGGVIAIDRVLWHGHVWNEHMQDEETRALRELNTRLRDDKRVITSTLTVGDGLTLCVRRE